MKQIPLDQALIELIIHGSEERNIEYKGTMSWDDNDTRIKVVKAAMAMANIRDGGDIIFGVEQIDQDKDKFEPKGMDINHADTFSQDIVSEFVNEYADPFVELKVKKYPMKTKFLSLLE